MHSNNKNLKGKMMLVSLVKAMYQELFQKNQSHNLISLN